MANLQEMEYASFVEAGCWFKFVHVIRTNKSYRVESMIGKVSEIKVNDKLHLFVPSERDSPIIRLNKAVRRGGGEGNARGLNFLHRRFVII